MTRWTAPANSIRGGRDTPLCNPAKVRSQRLTPLPLPPGFLAMLFLSGRRLSRRGLNHPVKSALHFPLEISLDLIDVGEFCECPAAVSAEMIHARHPVRVHRGFLFL